MGCWVDIGQGEELLAASEEEAEQRGAGFAEVFCRRSLHPGEHSADGGGRVVIEQAPIYWPFSRVWSSYQATSWAEAQP